MSRMRRILSQQLNLYELENRYPPERIITGQGIEPYVVRDGRKMLQFSGLDYLGLATDPRVEQAAIDAIKEYGVGALASRLTTGTLDIHRVLEARLAEFMCAEDAVVFTSGMLTNLGTLPAVICPPLSLLVPGPKQKAKRSIFIDELSHASLKDATWLARWGRTGVYEYRHSNMGALQESLQKFRGDFNLIVTDGVFSMDGDIAPLNEIVQLAEEFDAAIYCDDAHGVGVIGQNGRGACELCGVESSIDIRMGVISKAFGTLGGYIVGDAWFIRYLRHCRTQIFSMGVPAAEAAATIKALEIARQEPWRRAKVLAHADYLRSNLLEMGFNTLGNMTQIVPVLIGEENLARQIEIELDKRDILSPMVEYPSTPIGKARLRLFPTALYEKHHLDQFLNAMAEIKEIFANRILTTVSV